MSLRNALKMTKRLWTVLIKDYDNLNGHFGTLVMAKACIIGKWTRKNIIHNCPICQYVVEANGIFPDSESCVAACPLSDLWEEGCEYGIYAIAQNRWLDGDKEAFIFYAKEIIRECENAISKIKTGSK